MIKYTRKYTIPILLTVVVVIAGIFAFAPVMEASTVHISILEGSTNYVVVTATSSAADDDFTIFCPTTSDACMIREVYLDDDLGGETVNPGIATLDIDAVGADEAAFTIAADTGAATVGDEVVALNNLSGLTLGPGNTLRIEMDMTGVGFPYTLIVVAEVEGNETITVSRIGDAD